MEMMQTTTDRQERARWMSALTCSRDTSLLKRYYLSNRLVPCPYPQGGGQVLVYTKLYRWLNVQFPSFMSSACGVHNICRAYVHVNLYMYIV